MKKVIDDNLNKIEQYYNEKSKSNNISIQKSGAIYFNIDVLKKFNLLNTKIKVNDHYVALFFSKPNRVLMRFSSKKIDGYYKLLIANKKYYSISGSSFFKNYKLNAYGKYICKLEKIKGLNYLIFSVVNKEKNNLKKEKIVKKSTK